MNTLLLGQVTIDMASQPQVSRANTQSCGPRTIPFDLAELLVVHVVILILDEAVVGICEVGQGLVHLLPVAQVLGLRFIRRGVDCHFCRPREGLGSPSARPTKCNSAQEGHSHPQGHTPFPA